jgi:hypothetical protein
MNLSSIKGIFQKLNFFRDYSSLIIPGILAVVAALIFIPTTLMQHSLSVKIEDQSLKKQGNIIGPLVGKTPPSRQWMEQQKRQISIRNDANYIAQLAEQSSWRPPLFYDVFPEPKESSQQLFGQFGQRYRDAIDSWAADLRARECPTQAELNKTLNKTTNITNVDSTAADVQGTDKIIIDHLCREVAQSTGVYFDPTNMPGYKFWERYQYRDKEKGVEDCWYWQTGYWIIEDCFQTAKTLNAKSADVLDAPLKRIIDISFLPASKSSFATPAGIPYASSAQTGKPVYVTTFEESLTLPLTARLTNDRLDVVHFRLTAIVSSKSIQQFTEQLCSEKKHKFRGFHNELSEEQTFSHNQITVLKSDFGAINPDSAENKLYRYGSDGVVKIELLCEYIFDKKGYDPIKPASVKKNQVNK